jgi:hypothetical protein
LVHFLGEEKREKQEAVKHIQYSTVLYGTQFQVHVQYSTVQPSKAGMASTRREANY